MNKTTLVFLLSIVVAASLVLTGAAECTPTPGGGGGASGGSSSIGSIDPNEISGPSGFGENRIVQRGDRLDYVIYFENKQEATAAAYLVKVTLPQDPNLDWTTLRLGEVVVSSHTDLGLVGKASGSSMLPMSGTPGWSMKTDVVQSGGNLEWTMRLWDPATIDHYPDDPTAGILPPNDPDTHIGEGHVSFSVSVKSDAADGAVARAAATIVFDTNDPITTDPSWWNTVGEIRQLTLDLGDGTTTNLTLVVGQPFGELPVPAAREGYDFVGWYLTEACDGEPVTAETIVPSGFAALYPSWSPWQSTGDVGKWVSFDLVDDLGIEIPEDVDYAKGDKVTVKVEGLAKGLKVVATPVYEDPNAKKKVIVDYVYTIEGVPTEPVDFEKQPMYARVTVTYKDKTKTADKTGKAETLQPVKLSIESAEVRTLEAGALNAVYEPVDIAALWPEVADARVNPKEWSFKGWPAGIKYNATAKDASWSYKDDKATVKATAAPYTVYGQPTKAGEYPITATWKHKLADGKTTVSETFSAVLTVWGDDGASDFRAVSQAYVALTKNFGTGVTAMSGLPTGLKFTAKAVAATAKAPAQEAGDVYGTPTKPGVFAVTATKSDKTKETFLWKVAPAAAPEFALDPGTAPIADLRAQIVQGANQSFAIAASEGAKVSVSGLPSGLKLVQDKTTGLYSVEGVASKPGEYFVTFKTVLNGVTTVTTTAFTVKANPFAVTYCGYTAARPAVGAAYRLAVAEVTVAAAGTLKLTYTEGKTKYTASVKSFDWDDATGKGTAEGLVLKVSSADKKLGYGDRKATLTFEDRGAYLTAKLDIADADGSSLVKWGEAFLYATMKTTEVPLPASQTYVFRTKDSENVDAIATVSVAYDANKATAAFSGKLFDGTAVKATVPVTRVSDDGTSGDYAFAPFLVIAKDGTVICFENFFCGGGGYVDLVQEDGEHVDEIRSTSAQYALGDKKFAELVPETGAFTFGWGSDAETVGMETESFAFEVTTDAKGNPAGVAIYDADPQPGEKPLATVTAKVGKTTGAISVSFTSKKGDKAKYAVELVWRGTQLFAGQVTRTWKGLVGGKSTNMTASGTAEVTQRRQPR
ncbi:MAG: hypothetical protein Q4G65_09750 [bacterium]|nr:hypothetical protein [bacterium]